MTIIEAPDLFRPVDAPTGGPYRFGLFSVLTFEDAQDDIGVTWVSNGCAEVGFTENACVDPEVAALTPNDPCSVVQASPFTVYVYDIDSIAGRQASNHAEQARSRFLTAEQFGVEAALSALLDTATSPITSTLGTDPADKVAAAVAMVEQELATLTGNEGIILMSRFAASIAGLSTTGGMLRTSLGTPVAAMGGFSTYEPGEEPASVVVYGVGPMRGQRGPMQVSDAYALGRNDVSIIAQRTYTIGWDCGAVAVSTSL